MTPSSCTAVHQYGTQETSPTTIGHLYHLIMQSVESISIHFISLPSPVNK